MGGLYNMVLGDGSEFGRGEVLLAILGSPNPGRFRDAWVEKDDLGEPIIAVYTRNGGGNRECYCEDGTCTGCVGEAFAEWPGHIRNVDDEFDCTYATYYFRVPDEHRDALSRVAGEHVDTDQRWHDVINALNSTSRETS